MARLAQGHFVEYLGMQAATVVRPGPGVTVKESEPVVIITVRPESNSFRSHNFGICLAQAERLWEDLGSILGRSVSYPTLSDDHQQELLKAREMLENEE